MWDAIVFVSFCRIRKVSSQVKHDHTCAKAFSISQKPWREAHKILGKDAQ